MGPAGVFSVGTVASDPDVTVPVLSSCASSVPRGNEVMQSQRGRSPASRAGARVAVVAVALLAIAAEPSPDVNTWVKLDKAVIEGRRELEAQQKDKEPAEAEAPTEGAAPAEEAAGFNLSTDTVDYGLESPAPAEPAVPAQSELIAEEASL